MSSAVKPVAAKACLDNVGDHADGMAEDLATFHAEMPDGAGRGRAAVDIEHVAVAAVGAEVRAEDAAVGALAGLLLGGEHHGAGAVAEEDAGRAVGPVEDA